VPVLCLSLCPSGTICRFAGEKCAFATRVSRSVARFFTFDPKSLRKTERVRGLETSKPADLSPATDIDVTLREYYSIHMSSARENPGAAIRRLRREQILTQAELAKLAGMSMVTLSEIERGANTTVDTIQKIADALNVRVPELFGDEQTVVPNAKEELRQFCAEIHLVMAKLRISLHDGFDHLSRVLQEREKETAAAFDSLAIAPSSRSGPKALPDVVAQD
jgi:transcriptional regulator with XRE-family HTH domain